MSSANMVCYTIGLNYVTSSNQYFPCGTNNATGAQSQSCCYAGDLCMEDSMCHYTHGGVTNGTGYYMAGCTDPTWKDPACPKQCTSEYGADVVYDSTSGNWLCCKSTADSLNCREPSSYEVDAPSPQNLVVIKQITQAVPSPALTTGIGGISSVGPVISGTTSTATSAAAASASSSSATSTSASTTVASTDGYNASAFDKPVSHANRDLAPGAKAGIAVGVVFAVILTVLGIFLIWRKDSMNSRQRASAEAADSGMNAEQKPPLSTHSSGEASSPYGPAAGSAFAPSELPSSPRTDAKSGVGVELHGLGPQELDTERARQELPGDPARC